MSNNHLELKITTPAELSGAKSVEAALERDIGKAKALGEDFSALQKRLDDLRPAIKAAEADMLALQAAQQQKADALKKAADEAVAQQKRAAEADIEAARAKAGVNAEVLHAQKVHRRLGETIGDLTKAKGNLRSALKGLSVEFPMLGRLTSVVLNPISLAIAAVVTGLNLWRNRQKEIIALLEPSAWEGRSKVFAAQKEAIASARDAADDYRRKIEALKDSQDKLGVSSQELIGYLKEQNRWNAEMEDAEREVKRAQIDADEKGGRITPEEAEKRRAGLKKEEEESKFEREISGRYAEIDLKKGERDRVAEQLPTIEAALEAALERLEAMAAEQSRLDAEKERNKTNLESTKAKLNEIKAKNRNSRQGFGIPSADLTKAEFDTDKVVTDLMSTMELLNYRSEEQAQKLKDAEAELIRTKEVFEKAIAIKQQLDKEIPELESSVGIREGTGREILEKRQTAEDIRTQSRIEEIRKQEEERRRQEEERKRQESEAMKNRFLGGKGFSSTTDATATDRSGEVASAAGETTAAIEGASEAIIVAFSGVTAEMQTLKKRVEQIAQQQSNDRMFS